MSLSQPLTQQAHDLIAAHLRPGDMAIDATVGNGWDTVFLARAVGSTGRVFGFDIQSVALEQAALNLPEDLSTVVEWHHASHAEMRTRLPDEVAGHVRAIMFNLGYLPTGDQGLCTTWASTGPALHQAVELLAPGGGLTVLAYPGFPAGAAETAALLDWIDARHAEIRFRELGEAWPPASTASRPRPRLFYGVKPEGAAGEH